MDNSQYVYQWQRRRRKRALVKCCEANAITMYHKKAESKRATAEKKSLMNSNSR